MTSLNHLNVLLCNGPDFEDRELLYPYYRFLEAGANVTVAGLGEPVYKGKYGVPMPCTAKYEDVVNQRFDVVIIPGGWAPDKIRMNQAALTLVRQAMANNAVVGAICHAGWVLVSADVLRGRTVTSYCAIKDDMVNAGATWVDEAVVVDGNLVTSRTPDDLPAFTRTLIEQAVLRKQQLALA
jgi:protease I